MSASSIQRAGTLRFLGPAWFASVMGLCGLALAWWRAVPLMGDPAMGVALVCAGLALLVFVVLGGLSLVRWSLHPQAVADDMRHPVRHVFFAALPISLILLATVLTALAGPSIAARGLWMVGSAAQFMVTVGVLSRWLGAKPGGGLAWPAITPALLMPVVGNVVPALAGVELGYREWAAAQFGIGVFFWPVLMVLFAVRLAQNGLWPQRLLPTTFITVAPPSVIGLGLLQFGAPIAVVVAAWGIAVFFLLWSASVVRSMLDQPFGIPFWSLSFPLAAFSALSLRMSTAWGGAFQFVAVAALALTSLVILGLVWSTVQGLRRGQLLVPEPAAVPLPPNTASAVA